jgi:nucleoside-diphosphate-sugar epimerase
MFKNKKVIVTGGAGFIGSHVVDGLIQEGADVHIIDNLSGGKKEKIHPKATFHEADIRKIAEIDPIMKGAEYVFHLAALPRVQYSIDNPIETFEINALGTLNILDAARHAGVKRVVFSASSAAYGNQEKMPLVETMEPQPLSPYALHKLEGEQMCKLYSDIYGLSTVALRYFNVYGPGIDPEGSYPLALAYFLKRRSEGKTLTVTGDGTQTRDFTHVRDVVHANLLAATGEKVGKGEVINIGSGTNVTMLKVAEMIGGEIEHIPPRLEPKNTLADNTLARQLLGWTPSVPFEDGIAELKKIWKIN